MARVSIIIPTYNKAEYLNFTLAAFCTQTYKDFEIVVVNDGSTDATDEVIEAYGDKLNIIPVLQQNLGRSAARNAGLSQASGDIVIFNDDDRIPNPSFVAQHVKALNPEAVIIGWKKRALTVWKKDLIHITDADQSALFDRGTVVPELFEQAYQELITVQALMTDPETTLASVSLGDELDNYQKVIDIFSPELTGFRFPWALGTTGNMSCYRQPLLEVGGFDSAYQGWGMEDTDISYKLAKAGILFRVNPEAVNFHQVHPIGKKTEDSKFLSKEKQIQLAANVDYFCRKYDALDAYLFWRWIQRKRDLIAYTHLLNTIEEQNNTILEEELTTLYRELKQHSS